MKALEIMTRNILTVSALSPLAMAVEIMLHERISGLPVVDESRHLVGMLTEGDLLHRAELGTERRGRLKWMDLLRSPGAWAGEYVRTHSRRVEDLMTSPVVSATEDADLAEIVALMERHHVRRIPIVRDDIPVGMVSRSDLIRVLANHLRALPATGSSDRAVEEQLKAAIEKERLFGATNVSLSVQDGVVALDGWVNDDRCRKALVVAAQNIPGVKSVDDHLVWLEPYSVGYA